MRFDVIIGNPPYQRSDEGGHRPVPLYQRFVCAAKDLQPRHLVMITPSRWMGGGLGLSAYRAEMLSDRRIELIRDYPVSKEVFPEVEIKGGVSCFLWSRAHDSLCTFASVRDGVCSRPMRRALDEHDILVRDVGGLNLLQRVLARDETPFESLVASVRPFGARLRSNFRDYRAVCGGDYTVPLLVSRGGRRLEVWTRPEYVSANRALAAGWKVFLPKAGSDGGQRLPSSVIGPPRIGRPGQVSTETYLAIGPFASRRDAESAYAYLTSRFARYLISLRKVGHDNVPSTFRWLPLPDWADAVADEALYEKYRVSPEEAAHLEAMVAPWRT